jgi:uncharacterized protein YndB with AHSA1/START domain
MPTTNQSTKVLSDREFVLTHEFDAPAAKVFAAYTDPQQVPKWWGPRGAAVRVETMDLRPGGSWRFVQRSPDGREFAAGGTYLEVKPVTCLVYTFEVEGQAQKVTTTVELQETGGKTRATITFLCETKEQMDAMLKYGAVAGTHAAFKQLADHLRTV